MGRCAARCWAASLILFFSCLLYGGVSHPQEGRDVFRPYFPESPAKEVEKAKRGDPRPGVHPLRRKPVRSYTLMGVIISPGKKIALIQTGAGREHFVFIGDFLGNRDGVIVQIDKHGVLVRQGDGTVSLKTRKDFVIRGQDRERRNYLSFASQPSGRFEVAVRSASERYGVDPALIWAVMKVESNFNSRAVSPKGAKGLMQLMPETAQLHNVGDIFDPTENINGGVRHLRLLLDRFKGNVRMALAAYNAGVGAVEQYKDVPPFPETRKYVRRVLNYYQR